MGNESVAGAEVTPGEDTPRAGLLRRGWSAFAARVAWTPPARVEVIAVIKAAFAASLAWVIAVAVSDVVSPVLAPMTALITVRVSVHASVRVAIERSAAVVLGVLVALAIGNAIGLNAMTVGLLTGGSLAVGLLVLRLPRQAATQLPVTVLLVMSALNAGEEGYAWVRAFHTVLGAVVGIAVSLAFPSSRVGDARETLRRLAVAVADQLDAMGAGLAAPWSSVLTAEWRHAARVTRQRLVDEASEAIGNGREAAQWNIRDRAHVAELGRYEDVLPRFERSAIGVWAIARGLEDHVQLTGGEHHEMPAMAGLLGSLGDLVRVFAGTVLGERSPEDTQAAVDEVMRRREPCARTARRLGRAALDEDDPEHRARPPQEWMSYTALLIQVDRIVDDLRQPLPT
ncbi:MAG TPA: FUSC family protein [Microthrixaceae bacterium]|nr:FUSC family protein [Microthrixaceae bacterium]